MVKVRVKAIYRISVRDVVQWRRKALTQYFDLSPKFRLCLVRVRITGRRTVIGEQLSMTSESVSINKEATYSTRVTLLAGADEGDTGAMNGI